MIRFVEEYLECLSEELSKLELQWKERRSAERLGASRVLDLLGIQPAKPSDVTAHLERLWAKHGGKYREGRLHVQDGSGKWVLAWPRPA